MNSTRLLLNVVLGVCIAAIVWGGCQSCAHGATLRLSLTAPTQDNGGICGMGSILIPATDSLWVFVVVAGTSINDSVRCLPGTLLVKNYTLSPASYLVRTYAARFLKDGTKIAGCDTSATKATISQPGSVTLN